MSKNRKKRRTLSATCPTLSHGLWRQEQQIDGPLGRVECWTIPGGLAALHFSWLILWNEVIPVVLCTDLPCAFQKWSPHTPSSSNSVGQLCCIILFCHVYYLWQRFWNLVLFTSWKLLNNSLINLKNTAWENVGDQPWQKQHLSG